MLELANLRMAGGDWVLPNVRDTHYFELTSQGDDSFIWKLYHVNYYRVRNNRLMSCRPFSLTNSVIMYTLLKYLSLMQIFVSVFGRKYNMLYFLTFFSLCTVQISYLC